MKYIIMETTDGTKLPILFPEALTHSVVMRCMQAAIKECFNRALSGPVSAGFVEIEGAATYGKSESLGGMKPGPADADRIRMGGAVSNVADQFVLGMAFKLATEPEAKPAKPRPRRRK